MMSEVISMMKRVGRKVHTRKILAVLMLAQVLLAPVAAKASKQSVNILVAKELVDSKDTARAAVYLRQAIAAGEDVAVAHDMLGNIYYDGRKYNDALGEFAKAEMLAEKRDKEFLSQTLVHQAETYKCLRDTLNTILLYRRAFSQKGDDANALGDFGEVLYEADSLAEAKDVFERVLALSPTQVRAHYYLAFIQSSLGNMQESYRQLELGMSKDKNRLQALENQLVLAMMNEDYSHAMNYVEATLREDDYSEYAVDALYYLSDTLFNETSNHLERLTIKEPGEDMWVYYLGNVNLRHARNAVAVECYDKLINKPGRWQRYSIQNCVRALDAMEEHKRVIEVASKGLKMRPDNALMRLRLALAEFNLQQWDEAFADYELAYESDPNCAYYAFYRQGWIRERQKRYEEALELYDKSITMDSTHAYTYLMKGNLLREHLGRKDDGDAELRKCIAFDNGIEESTCRQFAYLALGDTAMAVAINDSLLAQIDDVGKYYDAACLYSRMHRTAQAVEYLRQALEGGYKRLETIESDDDLDYIRDDKEFKALMAQYNPTEPAPATTAKQAALLESTADVEVIPLIPESGGTYSIMCEVNGLPLRFMVDTGCSDIIISQVEYEFMMKNGYLRESDLQGEVMFGIATGEGHKLRQFNIRKLTFGNQILKNMQGGITQGRSGELLLGQSVLSQLGRIEIDYENDVLRIYKNNE